MTEVEAGQLRMLEFGSLLWTEAANTSAYGQSGTSRDGIKVRIRGKPIQEFKRLVKSV